MEVKISRELLLEIIDGINDAIYNFDGLDGLQGKYLLCSIRMILSHQPSNIINNSRSTGDIMRYSNQPTWRLMEMALFEESIIGSPVTLQLEQELEERQPADNVYLCDLAGQPVFVPLQEFDCEGNEIEEMILDLDGEWI